MASLCVSILSSANRGAVGNRGLGFPLVDVVHHSVGMLGPMRVHDDAKNHSSGPSMMRGILVSGHILPPCQEEMVMNDL